ncbi:hypothetical protein [Lysobacter sp. CA199]|uniref:hypothetical protein n=1 Tax=Lysobacter sp. CA199 TaxID=3455608 RepID=UPI003F8CF47B
MPNTAAQWAAMTTCYVLVGLVGWWLVFRTPGVLEAAILLGATGFCVVHFLEDAPHDHL